MFCDRRPVRVLGTTDQVRIEATPAVAALTRFIGGAPILLTGDNRVTATRLATQVGITDVCAGLLPAVGPHRPPVAAVGRRRA